MTHSGLGVGQLDCEQSAIANYMYTGVADDLRMTLVQTEVVRHLVHERRDLLKRLVDLLAMTQYIHTQRRKTDVHVEHDDVNSAGVRAASCVLLRVSVCVCAAAALAWGQLQLCALVCGLTDGVPSGYICFCSRPGGSRTTCTPSSR